MSDDAATSWRDITDQLTREQITKLDKLERGGEHPDGLVSAAGLLRTARRFADQNMIEAIYSPDPLPPDSTGCMGWRPRDEGYWSRCFTGTRRVVDGAATPCVEVWDGEDANGDDVARAADVSFYISVEIEGEQLTDGTVERSVSLDYGPDDQSIQITEKSWDDLGVGELGLNADAARRLGAALAEAADEVEKLAGG